MTIPKPVSGKAIVACVEWAPDEPSRLSDEEMRAYRQGRHTALAELAEELGIRIGVLEL